MSRTNKSSASLLQLSFLSLLLPLSAGVAHADEPAMGFYAGASVGRATLHRARLTRSDVEDHDRGFKALLGYRRFPALAFEATYTDYGDIQEGTRLAGDVDAFSVAVLGLIQLRDFDLFGKVGLGAWDGTTFNRSGEEVDDNDVDPMLGIGAQYRSGRFALRAEIEAQQLSFAAGEHGRDGDWVDLLSVGASWTF
jgi:hypothetical protein